MRKDFNEPYHKDTVKIKKINMKFWTLYVEIIYIIYINKLFKIKIISTHENNWIKKL